MWKPVKLTDLKKQTLYHGNILRLPAQWPYEEFVDFMVFDTQDPERPNGLIVSSGYKAGLILVRLPKESGLTEIGGLSTQWVINNWERWIYPECNVNDVYVIDRYTATAIS